MLSGSWQSQQTHEALRQRGHELGLDLYAIYNETGTLVRCSPGLLAQTMGYSVREVERWIADRRIPSQRVGRAREPILIGRGEGAGPGVASPSRRGVQGLELQAVRSG